MTSTDPTATTANDICLAALRDSGVVGLGQTAAPQMMTEALERLNWLVQQWQRKNWLVFSTLTLKIGVTGAQSYTVGPGGQIDTSQAPNIQGSVSTRPAKLESAFMRLTNAGQPVDYSIRVINSREEYNEFALKSLVSFTQAMFYDPAWPLGVIYPLPVATMPGSELWVTFRNELASNFSDGTTSIGMPYEYYRALVTNLALELRRRYQVPSFGGDPLPAQAREALDVIRTTNYALGPLRMPAGLMGNRSTGYNIFGDNYGP